MAIIIPGTIPAIKRAPTDSLIKIPITKKAILGGIRIPKEPPDATSPQTNPSSYFLFIISGMATMPIVMAQTKLDPVIAENIAQAIIVAIATMCGLVVYILVVGILS